MRELSRLDVMKLIYDFFKNDVSYFTTTGYTSREFATIIDKRSKFFPCIGGMGYVSSIAYNYCRFSNITTVCFDGDGSLLMQMGSIININHEITRPFLHILIDNNQHQSVGGFPLSVNNFNFYQVSRISGYQINHKISTKIQLIGALDEFRSNPRATFLQVEVNSNIGNDLPRIRNMSEIVSKFSNYDR